MTSDTPDLSQYRDLRIYDRDAESLYEVAEQDLIMKLPDWAPREDATEVMLLQALALQVSETMFAINRLPGGIMQILMQMYGVQRDEGSFPNAEITVRVADTFGHTIPAGTRFSLEMPMDQGTIVFATTEAAEVAVGETTVTITALGEEFTSLANNTPVGTSVELLDSISFVERAQLAIPVFGGRDAESDTEWVARGSARLRRLSDALVIPDHFTVAALEYASVSRAVTLDTYNPDSPTPANAPGHITVALFGQSGVLTAEQKEEIRQDLMSSAIANLTVHIADPTITTIDVTVTVKRGTGFTEDSVRASVIAKLQQYLNPNTWPWETTLRYNELIARIDGAEGVDYVVDVVSPAADVSLTGVAPLTQLGTVTVNFA